MLIYFHTIQRFDSFSKFFLFFGNYRRSNTLKCFENIEIPEKLLKSDAYLPLYFGRTMYLVRTPLIAAAFPQKLFWKIDLVIISSQKCVYKEVIFVERVFPAAESRYAGGYAGTQSGILQNNVTAKRYFFNWELLYESHKL